MTKQRMALGGVVDAAPPNVVPQIESRKQRGPAVRDASTVAVGDTRPPARLIGSCYSGIPSVWLSYTPRDARCGRTDPRTDR